MKKHRTVNEENRCRDWETLVPDSCYFSLANDPGPSHLVGTAAMHFLREEEPWLN